MAARSLPLHGKTLVSCWEKDPRLYAKTLVLKCLNVFHHEAHEEHEVLKIFFRVLRVLRVIFFKSCWL